MIRVILKGHDNTYGISDVLRLFCGNVRENKQEKIVSADYPKDIDLISEVYDDQVYTYKSGENRHKTEDFPSIPIKREVKRSLYVYMVNLTGMNFPWGCLTGIRPTVVAAEVDYDHLKLSEDYLVREDKSRLACITGANESEVLKSIPKEDINIYIGIPFCPSRCEYCSFISADATKHLSILDKYEDALEHELEMLCGSLSRRVSSVYIGGGTPTVFSDKTFEKLMNAVRKYIPFDSETEFTVEAGRPDTISRQKLLCMKDHNVGRICINPQTMNSDTLKKLNRHHSADDIIRVYGQAREIGFDVINMDLIAGLKYETGNDLIDSIKTIIDMKPENITVHSLYKKRRAVISMEDVLDKENSRGDIDVAVTTSYELLNSAGYIPYYMYRQKDTGHGLENIGFSLSGAECRYNVAMMTDTRDVLSVGAGGMSKRIFEGGRYERCSCTKDVYEYIRNPSIMAEKKIRFFQEQDGE